MSSRRASYSEPTNLPPTALERAAAKAKRAREKEQQKDFDPYLDTRAGASPSRPTSPRFQSVDWASTPASAAKEPETKGSTTSTPTTHLPAVNWDAIDEPSGLGNERGGEVKRGVYEAWHLTYEPMRRPSMGLWVWECVKMNPAHFPTVAQEKRERRCKTCGHWLAPVEWVESGGIGAG